jgi:hypothetical protein
MKERIGAKWVVTEVDKKRSDGVLFTFGIKVIGEKNIDEDQYKSPTRRHIQRQSFFRSSFAPTKSFGGRGGKLSKRIDEALKLKSDLLAHDNVTEIPAGTEVEVHDPDPGLPDVDWGGTTTNVDRDKLGDAIDKASEPEFKKIFKEGTINSYLQKNIGEVVERLYFNGHITIDEKKTLNESISKALEDHPEINTRKVIFSPSAFKKRIDKLTSEL